MITAPFAAPDPQIAAAAAPFNMVMLSMSSAGMSFKRDCWTTPAVVPPAVPEFPARVLFEMGTPSTIINGELFPRIVFCPRI